MTQIWKILPILSLAAETFDLIHVFGLKNPTIFRKLRMFMSSGGTVKQNLADVGYTATVQFW